MCVCVCVVWHCLRACRDPFALRAEQLGEEGQVLSDWDRFARGEYLRLAVEEEPEDMQVGVCMGGWVWLVCVGCPGEGDARLLAGYRDSGTGWVGWEDE